MIRIIYCIEFFTPEYDIGYRYYTRNKKAADKIIRRISKKHPDYTHEIMIVPKNIWSDVIRYID